MTTLQGKPPLAPFTWREAVPRLVQVAAKAPQPEAREFAMQQLLLLAEIVDRHIAQLQALHDALPDKEQRCADCGVRGGAHAFECSSANEGVQEEGDTDADEQQEENRADEVQHG